MKIIDDQQAYFCVTCGAQFPKSQTEPTNCAICLDERQYVNIETGQQWTTLDEMKRGGYHNTFKPLSDHVTTICTEPSFAIGQRAFLIQTEYGNILWDCISYIDDETVTKINDMGGLKAIAISHPHFYTGMNEWSKAFGGIPVYIHADDQKWIMRDETENDELVKIVKWEGETLDVLGGNGKVTMIRCGGHFAGSSVLHWNDTLFTADTIYVVRDMHTTSMYSYPNMIPLPAKAIQQIWESVKPFQFEKLYSLFNNAQITRDAKKIVFESSRRYLRCMGHSEDIIQ